MAFILAQLAVYMILCIVSVHTHMHAHTQRWTTAEKLVKVRRELERGGLCHCAVM